MDPTQNLATANGSQPMLSGTQLTAQQKLAMALMQQNSQQQSNPQGQYSPWQGAGQLANSYLAAQMLQQGNQQQPFQLGANVSPGAMQNANGSQDPLGALIATQGWTTPGTN